MASNAILTIIPISVPSKTGRPMAKVSTSGATGRSMTVSGSMDSNTDMEYGPAPTAATLTSGSGVTPRLKAMGSISGKTVTVMKASGNSV